MKSLPQLAALVWIAIVAIATAIVLALIGSAISTLDYSYLSGGDGIDSDAVALKASLAALSNVLLVVGLVGALLALALSGVRRLVADLGGSREGSASESAVGHSGVDLRGGDGGVPEEPLHRE